MQQQNAVYWMHEDPVAKSKRVTDSAGNVVSTIELDPWGGETNRSSNETFQPKKFTTYERDVDGSDEAMHRRYNRWWSRFEQPDPYDGAYNMTDPQSFNRYSYVQNDPVNFVDPSGLFLSPSSCGSWAEDPSGEWIWIPCSSNTVTVTGSWDDMSDYLPNWTSNDFFLRIELLTEPLIPLLEFPQEPLDEKEIQRRIAEGKAWDDWYKWLNCNAPIMSKYNAQLKDFHRLGGEAFWAEVGAGFGVFALIVEEPNPIGVWGTFLIIVGVHSWERRKLNDIISNYKKEVAENCGPKPKHPSGK